MIKKLFFILTISFFFAFLTLIKLPAVEAAGGCPSCQTPVGVNWVCQGCNESGDCIAGHWEYYESTCRFCDWDENGRWVCWDEPCTKSKWVCDQYAQVWNPCCSTVPVPICTAISCPAGETCQNDVCVAPPPPPTPTPAGCGGSTYPYYCSDILYCSGGQPYQIVCDKPCGTGGCCKQKPECPLLVGGCTSASDCALPNIIPGDCLIEVGASCSKWDQCGCSNTCTRKCDVSTGKCYYTADACGTGPTSTPPPGATATPTAPTNTPTPTLIPPTPTNTPTPTATPTPTPTPTPYLNVYIRNSQGGAYSQEICNATWNCGGTATNKFLYCAVRSNYTTPILVDYTCSGVRTPKYVYDDLLGITPAPVVSFETPTDTSNAFYGWPKWLTGLKEMTLSLAYNIRGWVYRETGSNPPTYDASDSLLSGLTINLSGAGTSSTTSQASALSPYNANYIFNKITDGIYNVGLAVTPTGSVLWSRPTPGQQYTNPQIAIVAGGPVIADFPFVTVTPVPAATLTPTVTPSSTPMPPSPTPTPTDGPCTLPLPTPVLVAPAHQLCTRTKPTFSATVSNPNGDSVWAQFYSNAYETFDRMGSVQPYTGGNSQWTPDGSVLNSTGGYWWIAYTKSPNCSKSADAPAWLINMDYSPPPQPTAPNCILQSQDLVSGKCTFSCSWPDDPETDNSCSQTSDYHPTFWSSPGPGSWDADWCSVNPGRCWRSGSNWNIIVGNVQDGQLLNSQLAARDSVGNVSNLSAYGGPFTCPCIIGGSCGPSPTPSPTGIPTLTPSPTPTPTIIPTPTITPTPTPGDWIQTQGGDTYQKTYNYPIPAGKYFITDITPTPGQSFSGGIAWSGDSSWNFGLGNISSTGRKAGSTLTNAYNFSYFVESLKNKSAPTITDTSVVGTTAKLDATNTIYTYSGLGYYTLDTNFGSGGTPKTSVTIFIISGSLEITQNFTIPAGYSVVFVVNGNINIGANVTQIPGLYISSQTFSVAISSNQLTINGMAYARNFSFNRTFRSFATPAYQFIYQPQYMIALLPYMGRAQVNWQEVKP